MSVPKKEGGPPIEFNNDGSLKSVEIRIVNLQLDVEASKTAQNDIKKWEEIGVWQATPKKSNDVVGLGIGDGLNSAALPYNHGTYSKVSIIRLVVLGLENLKKKDISCSAHQKPNFTNPEYFFF